jgi:hypothetical protein
LGPLYYINFNEMLIVIWNQLTRLLLHDQMRNNNIIYNKKKYTEFFQEFKFKNLKIKINLAIIEK